MLLSIQNEYAWDGCSRWYFSLTQPLKILKILKILNKFKIYESFKAGLNEKNNSIYLKLRSPMRNIMQPLTNSSIWISLRQNGFILAIAHQTNCFTSNSLRIVARIISAEFSNVTITRLKFGISNSYNHLLWNKQLFLRY